MALVQVSDVIVPAVFSSYVRQITEQKTRIIQAGVLVRDTAIDELLDGGGLTFNVPSWKDLADDSDNVSTDVAIGGGDSTPANVGTSQEVAVRLSRNKSWSASDLAQALAGDDPMAAIGDRVSYWWARKLQAAFIASIKGVFADNATAPSGSEHVLNDLTVDISDDAGGAFQEGVTNFTAEAFIDTAVTIGDSMEDLTTLLVHSIVYARMQKNNLIDFIPDSQGVVNIPTFLGRRVVSDDGMPVTGSVYESWLFGPGAVRLGVGSPRVPTEVEREPKAGNGGGQEILYSRTEWCIHPVGHKYAGSPASGGPSNANTSNNLANAGSWQRVFPERKQIKVARLISRES